MATLHIETTAENKSLWVRAAQLAPGKAGPGLAPWVISTLNEAAEKLMPLNITIGAGDPITWEQFASDNAHIGSVDLDKIRADLLLVGMAHPSSAPGLTIRRVPHIKLKHY